MTALITGAVPEVRLLAHAIRNQLQCITGWSELENYDSAFVALDRVKKFHEELIVVLNR